MATTRRDLVVRCAAFSARLLRFHAVERGRGRVAASVLQQSLRAGTAIGAHCAEAESAITRRHLISLRSGALREAREAQYWLQLLQQSKQCANDTDVTALHAEATELVAILATSVKRLRETM